MLKKVVIILLAGTASVQADWFDDMAVEFGDKLEYNDAKALEIITKVVQEEEKEVAEIEKKARKK